jgi:carbon monoxide dehydrogenase subunit G
VKIDQEFAVNVPIGRAWEVLTDLEGIAPCMPGAQLTGVEGDVFSGKVKVKVGPVISDYSGTARFVEKDDASYHAVIDAKGKDSRGAGNANALIDARLTADGDRTVVTVSTDLNISGKVAQFGSGMIKEVSAKLLGQFVGNLEAMLLGPAADEPEETVAVAPEPPVPRAEPQASPTPAPAATPIRRVIHSAAEPEPLDLMSVAGASVYKRALPPVIAALVVLVLIVWAIARR